MIVSATRAALRHTLSHASELIAAGGMSHVTIRAGDALTVAGADSTAEYIGTVAGAHVSAAGVATVDLRQLFAIVRELPADPELSTSGAQFVIRAGSGRFVLPTVPDVDAHPVQAPADLPIMHGSELSRILSTVAASVAQEDVRWGLNGVHLEHTAGRLTAVSTDGHRLTLASMDAPTPVDVPARSLLSRRAVKAIAKLADGGVRFGFVDGAAWLVTATEAMRFTLIDGEFPDYRAILPKAPTTFIECRTADLQAALRRVALVGAGTDKPCRLTCAPGTLSLDMRHVDRGESSDTIDATVTGATWPLGLAPRYLADALSWCGETVTLGLTGPTLPIDITSADAPGARGVIMPMRLD